MGTGWPTYFYKRTEKCETTAGIARVSSYIYNTVSFCTTTFFFTDRRSAHHRAFGKLTIKKRSHNRFVARVLRPIRLSLHTERLGGSRRSNSVGRGIYFTFLEFRRTPFTEHRLP